MQQRYAGKVVVVTGGGSGLGRDMAEAFAREGAQVAILGRRQDKLDEVVRVIETAGGAGFGLAADVRDAERIEAVMKEIQARAGRIDVLVNNAAGNFIAPAETLSTNGFKSVVDIVLLGTFNCTRHAFEGLRESQGAILNIIAAYAWSGEPGAIHSASAKAGVLAMTHTLASEWGRYRIRANGIAPGPIRTEGTDKNLWSVGDIEERARAAVPMGRLGEPADISRAALWLCSEEANWVSGATLTVDGAQWLHGGSFNFRGAYDEMMAKLGGAQKP
ncbi:MAG TPA: SDR family oxidoreductase [Candidatus Dormibacteraeota bacterium]|nr:SDR family oxidoreductase [Candidatus Dormibacteraeota bacterium]